MYWCNPLNTSEMSLRAPVMIYCDVVWRINREFKQSTTAAATTAAVTEKVWGEYVSVVCKFLSLGQQNTKKHG